MSEFEKRILEMLQDLKRVSEANSKTLENLYNLFLQYDRNIQDEILRDQGKQF